MFRNSGNKVVSKIVITVNESRQGISLCSVQYSGMLNEAGKWSRYGTDMFFLNLYVE